MTKRHFLLILRKWWRCFGRNLAPVSSVLALTVSIAALTHTYNNTLRNERAYVFVNPGNVFNVSDGNAPEPRIIIGNSGHTLAKHAKRWASATVSKSKPLAELNALGSGLREEGTLGIVPNVQHALIRFSERLQPGQ